MSGSTRPLASSTRSAGTTARSLGALGALVLCCLLLSLGASPAVGAGAGTADSPESAQANVSVTTETADGTVSVAVRIVNTGEATGRYAIELVAEDDGLVAERDLRVPPNGTRQAAFDAEITEKTTYAVYVNDVEVERFTVTVPTESTASSEREVPGPVLVSLLGGTLLLVVGAGLFRLG
ncbi:hypothetical protein [Haloparvum sp. AD34]